MNFVLIIVIAFIQFDFIASFNVDTKSAIVFDASDEENGSEFGTSVTIQQLTQPQRRANIVIGAPKLKSTNNKTTNGAAFNCDHFDENKSCKAITFQERSQSMHLGASVSSFGRRLIVCAPLWINKIGTSNPSGLCRLFDNRKQSRLSPFEDEAYQLSHRGYSVYYATALFGFSSFLDKTLTVIGAPGFADFQGSIVVFTGSKYRSPVIYHHKHTKDEYMGYAVTVGRFFSSKGPIVVAGAPRCNLTGCIYMFEEYDKMSGFNALEANGVNRVFSADNPMSKQGEQLGEYFGASVLAVDVNNDAFDDLIVGAPFYSPSMTQRGDCGRIFVFLSDGERLRKANVIEEDTNSGARFGTAISSVGDLNTDGFNDIAVGAPYEDDGKGSIYIYHGGRSGLKIQYAQKISASEHLSNHNLRGFGISISSGVDVDNNNYRDLLVGAYNSDKAVLLRTKPSANIKMEMLIIDTLTNHEFTQINLENPRCSLNNKSIVCFKLSYCVTLSSKFVSVKQKLSIRIDFDGSKRRSFAVVSNRETFVFNETIEIEPNNETCSDMIMVYVRNPKPHIGQMDKLTPLSIHLTAEILNDKNDGSFCKDCLVLPEKLSITELVDFEIGCGSDRLCESDLHLNISSSLNEIIHGFVTESNELELTADIINKAENAFSTKLKLIVKPVIEVLKIESHCRLESNDLNMTIICNVGNPFESQRSFGITFDLRKIPSKSNQLTIDAELTTNSHLSESSETTKNISLEIKRYASLKLFSEKIEHLSENIYSDKSTRNESQYKFKSNFRFKKLNHTFVEKAKIMFNIPSKMRDSVFLIEPSLVLISESDAILDCKQHPKSSNDTDKDIQRDVTIKKSSGNTRIINQIRKQHSDIIILDCETSECFTIDCEIGPFDYEEQTASIELNAAIDLNAIDKWYGSGHSSILLTIEVQADLMDTNIISQPVDTLFPILFRTVIHESSIIVVIASSFTGLIILVILFILLFKYGFFERKQRKQVKELKRRSAMINPTMVMDVNRLSAMINPTIVIDANKMDSKKMDNKMDGNKMDENKMDGEVILRQKNR